LPELGGEEAGEAMLMGDSGEAGLGEGSGVVGEVGGAKAGEEAEGEIQAADEEFCGETHGAGGNAEVGDKPEGSRTQVFCGAGDKGIEFRLGEAVEEEVGDYQVVVTFERVDECVGVVRAEAKGGVGRCCLAALAEEPEHGSAGVDCVAVELGVVLEELGEEATVTVAQDQGMATVKKLWEIVSAGVFQCIAEGEVFEPAIGTGYEVEVGFVGIHRGGWMVAGLGECGRAAHDVPISKSRYGAPGIRRY
jgi:hypothetical protein